MRPGGRLIAPTYCHDETRVSWALSRLFGLTGFPGHRRFSVRSLRTALESNGLRESRWEAIAGLFPIGYVEGTFP
jgi:hypothetical protein